VGLNLNPGPSSTEASLAVGLEKSMDVCCWVKGELYSRYSELIRDYLVMEIEVWERDIYRGKGLLPCVRVTHLYLLFYVIFSTHFLSFPFFGPHHAVCALKDMIKKPADRVYLHILSPKTHEVYNLPPPLNLLIFCMIVPLW